MRRRMSFRAATVSWLARVGVALGVVFDMTVKPDVLIAAIVVVVAMAAGLALGLLTRQQVAAA
jgi:ABC-type Mn2+/Zn2+ transport system permease subunit